MRIYVYDLTLKNNSFYISSETIRSLIKHIEKKSKHFKCKGEGIVNAGKILYFESDINSKELHELLYTFIKKYEYIGYNFLIKKIIIIEEDIILSYNDLIKDAYHHDKMYPDYGSNNENLL